MGFKGLMMAGVVALAAVSGQVLAIELDYAKAEKGTYVVDSSHALVHWKVWHMGTSHYTGRFDKVTGTMTFDPAKPEASTVSVAIDALSASTTSTKLTQELVEPMFLNASTYPSISFKSSKVEVGSKDAEGKQKGKVYGDLTLHGVTKPVVLEVVFNGSQAHPMNKKEMMGFSGKTLIKRSDFGVSYGVPMVGDEVEVDIEIEFNKAG